MVGTGVPCAVMTAICAGRHELTCKVALHCNVRLARNSRRYRNILFGKRIHRALTDAAA